MREAGGAVGASEVRILGRASPSELIALLIALEEREGLEERDRRRLDREIGERAAREGSRDGWALLRRWLDEAPKPETKKRIARVASSMQLFRTLLVAIGLFLGWAAAAALLQVEVHAGRVNIVLCIGLLVILPFALLLAAILASAWLGRASADPAGFSGGWRGLAFVRFAMSILPEGVRRDVELLLGRMTVNERLYAEVRRA